MKITAQSTNGLIVELIISTLEPNTVSITAKESLSKQPEAVGGIPLSSEMELSQDQYKVLMSTDKTKKQQSRSSTKKSKSSKSKSITLEERVQSYFETEMSVIVKNSNSSQNELSDIDHGHGSLFDVKPDEDDSSDDDPDQEEDEDEDDGLSYHDDEEDDLAAVTRFADEDDGLVVKKQRKHR